MVVERFVSDPVEGKELAMKTIWVIAAMISVAMDVAAKPAGRTVKTLPVQKLKGLLASA